MNARIACILAVLCVTGCGAPPAPRNENGSAASNSAAADAAAANAAEADAASFIPPEFHGRWAEKADDCTNKSPATTAIEIKGGGWLGWEESARVTEPMRPLGESPRYRVVNRAGADEYPGTLALHRVPTGLAFEEVVEGRTIRTNFVRCV